MRCPHCGHENRGNASFCQGCGKPLAAQGPANPGVSMRPTKPLAQSSASQAPPSASQPETRPLAGVSAAFAPLPEGALLRDGRYAVKEVRAVDEYLVLYLAEDVEPVVVCPNCQTGAPDPEERFCSFCGADLSGVKPLHLRYLVKENPDVQAFTTEAQLLEMRLEHPGLLLPRDVFSESPYDSPRRYLVESEFPPPLASSLPVPHKLNQVVAWGVSLAHALDYLHRHQVTLRLRDSALERIAVEGGEARWTQLGMASVIPPEARPQSASYFSHDVRGLATTLFYLATGQAYSPTVTLPEPVSAILAQILAAPQGGVDAATFGTALEAALQELRRPASVTFVVGRRTDVGQERSLNEDSLLTVDIAPVYRSVSAPVGVFAVADGMGGHEAGDVASQSAIQAIAQRAVTEVLSLAAAGKSLPEADEWLTAATQAANKSVYDRRKAAGTDMGTTLVVVLFVGDTATISNVGDSRAYLFKENEMVQVTTDHSLVERLVATGQITREEAANHPQKNVIYRVIGDKPRVQNDVVEQRLVPGQALLLCSDGLSGMVPDTQMWHIWKASTSPQDACDRLVEAANQAGGEDNITVVIVKVER